MLDMLDMFFMKPQDIQRDNFLKETQQFPLQVQKSSFFNDSYKPNGRNYLFYCFHSTVYKNEKL